MPSDATPSMENQGMLSAARYPIVLYGPLHLFPVLPHSVMLYAALRKAHTILAYLVFVVFIAHFGAVLFHTLILRDRLFSAWRLIESPRAEFVSFRKWCMKLPKTYLWVAPWKESKKEIQIKFE
jgi:hypothetical protein